ncbi:MAG: competence protein [Bacteroidetes bacterium HGW-Bacteroidetes-3]|nr:MAG: competence protein [Bacteroidetes bacterium HGW-Bacteroidetes-3]
MTSNNYYCLFFTNFRLAMIKFLKFIPAQLTFFLIVGILFGNYFSFLPIDLFSIFGGLILLLTAVYFFANTQFQTPFLFPVLVFLISFFIGIGAITFNNQLNNGKHYSKIIQFSAEEPVSALFTIESVLKSTKYYHKYEAEVFQLNGKKTIGKILVNIKKDSANSQLQVDDCLAVKMVFSAVAEPLNPYGFNYKKYLQQQQIHHQIYGENFQFLRLPKTNQTLKGIAAKIREKINLALIQNGFKDDELAVVNALLLGQRQHLTSELQQSYVGAGAIHILAISGLHIGIILLILTAVFKPLHYFKYGKLTATIIIIAILWMYAIIAGLSASVVRAVTMFTSIAIAMQVNRPSSTYKTLVISMFFLLLFNPYYLFEMGFQLSYLAVFSIVWIQPKIYHLWSPKFWILDKLWQLLTVSMAAQIGVLPLSLYYFHQFPGLFFVSNLVIIPVLGIILTAGIIIISLAVLQIAPQFLVDVYIFIIRQMNHFVSWISNQEFFIIQQISFSFLLIIAFYALLFFGLKWTEKKVFFRFVLVLISVILIQTVFVFEKYKLESTKEFIVFNESNSSTIGIRNGNTAQFFASEDSLKTNTNFMTAYIVGSGLDEISPSEKIKNLYFFSNETILIVDSLGIYKFNSLRPTIVILRQSPKINLERLIKNLNPKIVVADGTNYKSYLKDWEQTCLKNKTPFHNTLQKGAFVLNNNLFIP